MKKSIKQYVYFSLIFLVVIMFQSCLSSKNILSTNDTFTVESQQPSKKVKIYNAWVIKTNKTKIKGLLYSADLKGIVLARNPDFIESEFIRISANDIYQVKISKKGKMGKSAYMGAIIGTGFGAALGFMQGDDQQGLFSMTKEDKAIVNGIAFGIVGTGLGLIVGTGKTKFLIDGNSINYESNLGAIQLYSIVLEY